ncbi:MAG: radical SAM family heme chaperone HemW [Deltaproteobacteria bacterium]|nr:radical SAM family heme chaperone HemW [Deltaproteobacteria bacterium]
MPAGLYIHIPFCQKKCGYCNFYSVTSLALIREFITALYKEMELYRRTFDSVPFDTIYLGGGSPSVLSAKQIQEILNHVRNTFDFAADSEITIEINPGDIDLLYLQDLRGLGINRINIGVQSFNENILKFLVRRHSRQAALDAVAAAKRAGFDNIGIDLIYGIPGQAMTVWMETLNAVLSFMPEHLSCYQLTIEPDTPLGKKSAEGEFVLPDNDMQYDFFMKTSEILEAAGYVHYEVSNFAKDMDRASRHNQKYWDHTPYLGLGPAAHSFQDNQRWWNHQSLERYLENLKVGTPPVEDSETLTNEQLQLETLLLGLRTKKGINLERYKERFGRDLLKEKSNVIADLDKAGLIKIENGCLRPTPAGLAVADSLSLI